MSSDIKMEIPCCGSLGETCLYLPLVRQLSDKCVVYFDPENESSVRVSSLFKNQCRLVGDKKKAYDISLFKKYSGTKDPNAGPVNTIKRILFLYGGIEKDLIPEIKLDGDELSSARYALAQFTKPPIIVNIFAGQYLNPLNRLAHLRMLRLDMFSLLIDKISVNFQPVCVTTRDLYRDINKNIVPFLDLSPREQASLYHVAKKCISIESGQSHLAISSGATVYRLVPTFDYFEGFLYKNWEYTDDMWGNQKRRCFDFLFQDYDKIAERLNGDC